MYSSPQQRDADIRAGAERPPVELRRWARESADRLAAAYAVLGDEQWACIVRTAQGRLVAAAEIPWLRAREVMVHTVDLDPAPGFAGLPEDFVVALVDDVVSRRSSGDQPALELSADGDLRTWSAPGTGEPAPVRGTLGGIAAYLTGRPGADVTSPSGAVPDLPPWL